MPTRGTHRRSRALPTTRPRSALRALLCGSLAHWLSYFFLCVRQLRETVSSFFQKEVAPLADAADRSNEFPLQLWERFGQMGLLGLTAPEEYGGMAKGYLDHTIVMEEVRPIWGPPPPLPPPHTHPHNRAREREQQLTRPAQLSRASGSIALSYGAQCVSRAPSLATCRTRKEARYADRRPAGSAARTSA